MVSIGRTVKLTVFPKSSADCLHYPVCPSPVFPGSPMVARASVFPGAHRTQLHPTWPTSLHGLLGFPVVLFSLEKGTTMAYNVIFNSNDWSVENAPITGWGYNQKGTFYLKVTRTSPNGKPYPWTMNVPEFIVGNLPVLLDSLDDEDKAKLVFTGGWVAGNASVQIGLIG